MVGKSFMLVVVFYFLFANFARAIDPQYIFVRKDPMTCNPSDCSQLWDMANPNFDYYPGIVDVYNLVGTHGTNQRKLGIGLVINYNLVDIETLKQSLPTLLFYAKVHSLPLFLSLDGFQWWDNRPDLWNWWDQNAPGFNPDNINNVEWTCWDSSCATKKAWRNWGSEFEVKPHPNLASQAFIAANKSRSRILLNIIANWYNNQLSIDQKWLFGGVATTLEVDIGGNYFYYPNGVSAGGGISRSVQQGYSALKASNMRNSGGAPTSNELNTVVRHYLEEMDKVAVDAGIPRNKVFNHTGGVDLSPNPDIISLNFTTSAATLGAYGSPGWSFYGLVTEFPQNYPGVNNTLNLSGNSEWGSPEWLTHAGNQVDWEKSLRGSLGYRNNRFINMANWEGIRNKPEALAAIRAVLHEENLCWVTSPEVTATLNGKVLTFDWIKGVNNDEIYLNMSNSSALSIGGVLEHINIINDVVTSRNSYSKDLSNGTYYWTFIADGCNNQRKIMHGTIAVGTTLSSVDFLYWFVDYSSSTGIDFVAWRKKFSP
jgi:hypothetical protein